MPTVVMLVFVYAYLANEAETSEYQEAKYSTETHVKPEKYTC